MTGIRSWTVEVMAFGVVVKIEQVLTQFPLDCEKARNTIFDTAQRAIERLERAGIVKQVQS